MRGLPIALTRPLFGICGFVTALQSACVNSTKSAIVPAQTQVDYRAYVEAGAPRYVEAENETASNPVPIEHVAPQYPLSMIALHLPLVTVQAKVIVDSEGKVVEIRIAPAAAESPRPVAFDDAVRAAVAQWRYVPLRFTRWQEVADGEGNVVDSRAVSVVAKPFSLDYDFSFELRDGKPVVAGRPQRR